jgi:hypothetical protein
MPGRPTPYADVNTVLHELLVRVRNALSDNFIGAYLQGSLAVGDFDDHSDVDFVIITAADIPDDQVPALQEVHGDLFDLSSPWARHLEGSYIPKAALRQLPPPFRSFYYLDHGQKELVRSDHDDSLVVYWVLREKGITLAGPEPRSLIAPISADALRREVRDTMRDWRTSLLAQPEQLDNRWRQAFVVVSYCRMLQTLETGTIESKPAAIAWAKANLDHHWHPLIERAWKDRPDPSSKVRQKAEPCDLRRTREFMTYAVERHALSGS